MLPCMVTGGGRVLHQGMPPLNMTDWLMPQLVTYKSVWERWRDRRDREINREEEGMRKERERKRGRRRGVRSGSREVKETKEM